MDYLRRGGNGGVRVRTRDGVDVALGGRDERRMIDSLSLKEVGDDRKPFEHVLPELVELTLLLRKPRHKLVLLRRQLLVGVFEVRHGRVPPGRQVVLAPA